MWHQKLSLSPLHLLGFLQWLAHNKYSILTVWINDSTTNIKFFLHSKEIPLNLELFLQCASDSYHKVHASYRKSVSNLTGNNSHSQVLMLNHYQGSSSFQSLMETSSVKRPTAVLCDWPAQSPNIYQEGGAGRTVFNSFNILQTSKSNALCTGDEGKRGPLKKPYLWFMDMSYLAPDSYLRGLTHIKPLTNLRAVLHNTSWNVKEKKKPMQF